MFRNSQKHSIVCRHHFTERPDWNKSAEVPSSTLRTAFSATNSIGFWPVVIPPRVFTSANKSQRINGFLISRHELLLTFHRFLRAFSRRVTLHPTRTQDYVTVLQSSFSLHWELFVIRRFGISKFRWMMSTVFSRFGTIPARSSGSFLRACKIHNPYLWRWEAFHLRLGKCVKKKHCACQLACLCVASWTCLRSKEDRFILLRSSASYHQVLSLLTRSSPQRPYLKSWSRSGTLCDRSPSAWTPGKCNRSPDAWHEFSCLGTPDWGTFRDQSPDVLAPGIRNWSPDAVEGSFGVRGSFETATNGTWSLRSTSCHFSILNQWWRLSCFSIRRTR